MCIYTYIYIYTSCVYIYIYKGTKVIYILVPFYVGLFIGQLITCQLASSEQK